MPSSLLMTVILLWTRKMLFGKDKDFFTLCYSFSFKNKPWPYKMSLSVCPEFIFLWHTLAMHCTVRTFLGRKQVILRKESKSHSRFIREVILSYAGSHNPEFVCLRWGSRGWMEFLAAEFFWLILFSKSLKMLTFLSCEEPPQPEIQQVENWKDFLVSSLSLQ